MTPSASVMSAVVLVLYVASALSAEDHSAHRKQPDQQTTHSEAPQEEDHSAHKAPAGEGDSAHQPSPPPQDKHAVLHAESGAGHEHASSAHDQHEGPTESELRHVPPPPPQHTMGDMSKERMVELMQMEDDASVAMLTIDQLEWREIDDADGLLWEGYAWYGDDYNKVWFESEGERVDGEYESRNELLWDRIMSRWWSVQVGVRHDVSEGPSRTWASFGVQGLAPQWFEVEASIYVGEEGRTAARASAEYDLRFTQRLILQPEFELELYGKDDPANGIGSGLAEVEAALRLRYEIRREFAPYVGVAWTRAYGDTADLARAAGGDEDDVQFIAGLRVWF